MSNDNNENGNNGKMKIIFSDGCFDNFNGTQEELDELVSELQRMAEDGTLFENSVQLSLADMVNELVNMAELEGVDGDAVLKRNSCRSTARNRRRL